MMQSTLHPGPRTREVVLEQVRAVGLTLQREVLIAAVLAVAVTLGVAFEIADGEVIHFDPAEWPLPAIVALLFPFAVWKREKPFSPTFLWTLPVDRRRLALAKVFAGWVWLMALAAGFVLWLAALAFFSGGTILGEQTVHILPSLPDLEAGGGMQSVRWKPQPVLLLVPFSGATAMYLLGSAVALGLRRPLRWLIGTAATLFALGFVADVVGRAAKSESLIFAASRLLSNTIDGRYGLRTLLHARVAADIRLAPGRAVEVWRELPDVAQWATTTFLWLAAGLLALWLAASRHRERRPS